MIYRHLRLKINLIITLTAVFFVSFMWIFNTEMVFRNWTRAIKDLPIFIGIVAGIIVIALSIVFYMLKPLVGFLKKIEAKSTPDNEERIKALKAMVRLPMIIILLNVFGFF